MPTYRADIIPANDNRGKKKRTIILVILTAMVIIGTLGYFQTRYYLMDGLPDLPDKSSMWEMNLEANITILDQDGKEIGHRGPYIGEPLKTGDMPSYVTNAFLDIEDERFWEHTGIDNKAIFRALLENTKSGEKTQGGSTLTQQLVKNMVLTPEKTYRRKFQEMWLARELESQLTKAEILELYLNRISLGPRIFGIEAASRQYFGKSARELTLQEAAMLAGLPKAPSRLDPRKNYDGALARSILVLDRMLANGHISYELLVEARENPPVLAGVKAPDIDPDLIGYVFDFVTEQAQGQVGSKYNDLIVKTTIDPKLQKQGLASLEKIISRNEKSKKVSEGALVAIDTKTGAIRAMIGGRDYSKSKFNRAAQAKRQPGSAFKAFVYAAALEDGYTPATVRFDQPTKIGDWEPENYTRRFRGPITIREALKLSINTVAAQVGAEVGPSRVASLARRFGIKTQMRPEYSIALGSSEVTLVDLTTAYMVFANDGLSRPNYIIESITNTANVTLYERKDNPPGRAYAEPYAKQMTGMLKDVIDSGTGHGAKLGTREAAGKTGTSQDHRDAWFVGFTAHYTTGVWMGNDDNSEMRKVTGGLLPVDAWKDFMLKAHKGVKKRPIISPEDNVETAATMARTSFYSELGAALIAERDVANGVGSPAPASTNSGGVQTAGR